MIKFLYKNQFHEEVFHQKPIKRTIHYNSNPFFLSFPDILFVVQKKLEFPNLNLYIAFSNPNLTKFYYPNIPNVQLNLKVCLKLTSNNQLFDQFWKSGFNDEIKLGTNDFYLGTTSQKLQIWQTNTKNDPNYIPNTNELVQLPSHFHWFNKYEIPQNNNH